MITTVAVFWIPSSLIATFLAWRIINWAEAFGSKTCELDWLDIFFRIPVTVTLTAQLQTTANDEIQQIDNASRHNREEKRASCLCLQRSVRLRQNRAVLHYYY